MIEIFLEAPLEIQVILLSGLTLIILSGITMGIIQYFKEEKWKEQQSKRN